MKTLRGLIRVDCTVKKCVEDKNSMDSFCMNCTKRDARIVDLDEKTLFIFDKLKPKKVVKKTVKKEK